MRRDQFGFGNNKDTMEVMMSDKGTELIKNAFYSYGPGETSRMVVAHFMETGEYIAPEKMTKEVHKKLKSKKYNIRFNRHDWIDEMFFNLEKQSGAK
jgi:hypothetical protein